MNSIDEEWRDIPNYEGLYQVSDLGQVRSMSRDVACGSGRRIVQGRILKLNRITSSPNSYYCSVGLSKDSRVWVVGVHQLVLRAFVGAPAQDQEACHVNNDPLDNRPGNLYWGTHSENLLQAVADGNHINTRKTHCPQGHKYTKENTRITIRKSGNPGRQCITCHRAASREQHKRKMAAKK